MAGSFHIFRKYQRSLLVFVAILAMLAFFVLPPFLQMGADFGGSDPVVATWRGGELREGGMMRAVAMRTVVNQFLIDAMAASGRDPGPVQLLPTGEADVVRTLLLAREAEANGIVVSNAAINEFLGQWTNDMVRPEQFEAIIARRRMGPVAVSQADVFEALRQVLLANRMERMFFSGFAGDPPGWRWDAFRRLEQEATVEVVPLVVESFAGEVAAPDDATLQTFFSAHKDTLPAARSPDPGFKEPHRISCDYLMATRESLEAEAAKEVTDEQVKAYYEENKERLFKSAPADDAAEPAAPEAGKGEAGAGGAAAPDDATNKQTPDGDTQESDAPNDSTPSAPPQSAIDRGTFRTAAFRADDASAETKADESAATETKPDVKDAGKPDAKPESEAETKPAADATSAPEPPPAEFQPLEKVAPEIRKRLAADAAERRVDAVFAAVTSDVARYAEDLALWQAEGGSQARKPSPPDAEAIAKKQGLVAGRLEKVTASDALAAGGVAATFDFMADPGSPMGFRQVGWVDRFFGRESPLLRPVASRDVPGNRYLTWKTADQPAFAPSFATARSDVERAWRIVEARPLARAAAESVAKAAREGGDGLAGAVAGREPKLEVTTVGPFTWLSRGGAAFGSAPTLSQPDGLSMPGEEFMRAVFGLEPGGVAVAFNEPRTVCYVIRLVSFAPPEDDLRSRFIDSSSDQRRLMALAQQAEERAYGRWFADLERRAGLEWKRPPQR